MNKLSRTLDNYLYKVIKKQTEPGNRKTIYKEAILKRVDKDGDYLDIAKLTGQNVNGYSVHQGGCMHNGYAYIALYKKFQDMYCKLVKLKLDTLEVVKVTEPIVLHHANCLTYDTKRDRIVVTACRVEWGRAIYVDPETLEITGYTDITLNPKIKNITRTALIRYKGFTAIAYNEDNDRYYGRLRNINDIIEMDADMKPLKYIKLEGKRSNLMNQSIAVIDNKIYDVRSFKGRYDYNLITVHTLTGAFVDQIRISTEQYADGSRRELECLMNDGDDMYIAFYRSLYWKNPDGTMGVKRRNYLYQLLNL